jgi:hypothetical protein
LSSSSKLRSYIQAAFIRTTFIIVVIPAHAQPAPTGEPVVISQPYKYNQSFFRMGKRKMDDEEEEDALY